MRVLWGLPWVGLVLVVPALAGAQITVGDDPGHEPGAMRRSFRAGGSITLNNRDQGDHDGLVPEFHTVVPGDTLWDISGYYLTNPWRWPEVWGRNPQITNPHWIFPGDQVRLLLHGENRAPIATVAPGPGRQHNRLSLPTRRFPPGTAFLREEAWATPEEIDAAGTIIGAPEDVMLLSEGDQAYIEFFRRAPNVGESYTIYHEAQPTRGGDRDSGRVVRVLGTAIIDAWDPQRKLATARITESLDTIERGERVTFVQRQFQPVPPRTNDRNLAGHVVATPQPRTIVGAQFVVIVDRGAQDGVQLGNRMFLIRRGDPWRTTMTAVGARPLPLDRDGDGVADNPPDQRDPPNSSLPPEVLGEMIVVAVHPRSVACLVTMTSNEIEIGDPVVMRLGY